MSLVARLRLDEVITSLPELGPTLPDGGYSWIVLVGVMAIQVPVNDKYNSVVHDNDDTGY